MDYLENQGLASASLSFTPLDSYVLWEAFTKFFEPELIMDVSPTEFFPSKIDGKERILLDEVSVRVV